MKTILLLIGLFIGVWGCTQDKRTKETEKRNSCPDSIRIEDSVTTDGLFQNNYYSKKSKTPDSTSIYYTKEGQMESIHYNSSLLKPILSKGYYPDGKIKYIRYNNINPKKNDTIYITYYPNEKVNFIQTIVKDSLDLPKLYTSYYENGGIQEKGIQDMYNAVIISTGTWQKYDNSGNLTQTIFYHPDKLGKDYKIITTYNKKGQVISKKIYNYDDLYETELKELKKIP